MRRLPLHAFGKGATRMASVAVDLHASLRREARQLLDDAAAITVPARRRAILARAFCLVQQAEIYRQTTTDDLSLPARGTRSFEKRRAPAGDTLTAS